MANTIIGAKRWQEILAIWDDNRWLYIIVGLIAGILLPPAIAQFLGELNSLINNLVPEAIGIIFTVAILERLAENRQRELYKQNLIRQAGSVVNDVAVDAIEQMRKENWLQGKNGILENVDLHGANLEGARLSYANLQYVDLDEGNLQGADLGHADMQGINFKVANARVADFQSANLQDALLINSDFESANLQHANFHRANLEFSNLQYAQLGSANLDKVKLNNANLKGAILFRANLTNVIGIEKAIFDSQTVLPDANIAEWGKNGVAVFDKHWSPKTDMARYTDPTHSDFWKPKQIR